MFKIEITGEIVPYKRVGRERWTDRAKRYFSSRDTLRLIAGYRMAQEDLQMIRGKFAIKCHFVRRRRLGDLDNLLKAILDAFEGVVFENDKNLIWIHSCTIEYHKGPKEQDRTFVEIIPMDSDGIPGGVPGKAVRK